MSTSPETDFDLDLHFLPSWAQKPADQNRYANYQGDTGSREGRPERRDRPGQRRDQGARGPGRTGQQPGRGGPRGGQGQGPRPERRGDDRRRGGGDFGGPRRQEQRPSAPPVSLPEVNVAFIPDDRGVDSLA